jgi:AbrB family looped-hinge helix DNA binding protein
MTRTAPPIFWRSVESAITTKGEATIPKAVREHLGLKCGNWVFFMHPDGNVVILPGRSASVLRGIVKTRGRRRGSIKQMSEAAAAGAAVERRRVSIC